MPAPQLTLLADDPPQPVTVNQAITAAPRRTMLTSRSHANTFATAVTSLNDTFAPRLERLGLRIPGIFLPAPDVDLRLWAVVACDQYTSDRAYWSAVEAEIGLAPSALSLILPEILLGQPDVPERVVRIHAAMHHYLEHRVVVPRGECCVYVRRSTAHSGLREGLVVAIDLDRYDYSPGSKSLVRATEATIVDRIPPRLAVRRGAPLELPHIMVLVDDPEHRLIESWSDIRSELPLLYDTGLMQNGGHVEGRRIDSPEHLGEILGILEDLEARARRSQGTDQPLFWAMGDGNHSLATAKANWEEVRVSLRAAGESESSIAAHPARHALVEIVNIHSPGLRFEPIHRAFFSARRTELPGLLRQSSSVASVAPISEGDLQALLAGPDGQDKAGTFDGQSFQVATFEPAAGIPPGLVDRVFDDLLRLDPAAKIDFIHGWDDTKKLTAEGAGVFFLPVLGRDRLFAHVQANGPLPRKSFSMGDAEEKRFYLEARRITR